MLMAGGTVVVAVLRIRSRGAGGHRRNGGHGTGPNIDPTAIVINDRRSAARAHHDRVADLGLGLTLDWLEAMALIDQRVALARLNDNSPARAAHEHRAANAKRP